MTAAAEMNPGGPLEQMEVSEDGEKTAAPTVHSVLTRFKEGTTAHGIPHVHYAQGLGKTIFWFIIGLGATAGFCYNAFLLIDEYAAYNTTTAVTIESSASINLPAITFCNYNAILKTKLQNDPTLQALLSAFSGRRRKRDTEDVSHNRMKRSTRNSQYEFQQKIIDAVADFTDETKTAMGHQLDDLIVQCKYGYSCNITGEFTQHWDATYGNCFTYNWGRNGEAIIVAGRPGASHGLSIVFNTYQDEYVGFLSETAGMVVVIHHQNEMPFPLDEGIACSPGHLTNIGMKKVSISRMGDPYGDCIASYTQDYSTNVFAETYNVAYTSKACEVTCYQKNVISRCGCGDPHYPMTGKAFETTTATSCKTSNTTQDDCKESVLSLWNSESLGCSCVNPCNQDLFEVTQAVGMWPSASYKNELFGQLPVTTMLTDLRDANDTDKYKENLGKINIYFEEFNYENIQEDVAYEVFSLISDLGGILGLYIGFSMMTILEFFELGFDLLVVGCIKKNRSSTPVNSIHI